MERNSGTKRDIPIASTTPELTRKTVLAFTAGILAAPERRCEKHEYCEEFQAAHEHKHGE